MTLQRLLLGAHERDAVLVQDTVPQSLTCALEASSFEDSIRNAISIGGDSDTIAAIAGGLAEALFGIPPLICEKGWSFLPEDMQVVVKALYQSPDAVRT